MGKTIMLHGFPSIESPQVIKDFVEQITGEGSVYVVEIGQPKNEASSSRTQAKIQFTTTKAAEDLKSLADSPSQLWYGKSFLIAWNLQRDIVPQPKVFAHTMQNITLKFGCQVSKNKFCVLWQKENVEVKFGLGLKNFYFFLCHDSVEYKIELCIENVWQIELHCSNGQANNFLVFQLAGAPRIYEKDVPIRSYFKEPTNEHWIREVDFTPSRFIGQSSGMCLELPLDEQLPNSIENCMYYKEISDRPFFLERGSSFSCNTHLVPILSPPQGLDLPYEILFKINSLVQHGFLPGPALDIDFYKLVHPSRTNIERIQHALEKLYDLQECCYEPAKWLKERYRSYGIYGRRPKPRPAPSDDRVMYVHRVQVTPCKVYFCGPELNLSNRVLRNYHNDIDNFLRVSFVDEEFDKVNSTDLSLRGSSEHKGKRTKIYERILTTLREGIVIGAKKFEFLAFSSSQLRENSLWMFASRPGLTASDIRAWMGDFSGIKNVAKYAARLGQSFSSSRRSLNVQPHEFEIIPDIEITSDGHKYVFSDGIGKISTELAQVVAKRCGLTAHTPSAFQIRFGGYKGVVAIDPTTSMKLSLRPSMSKYKSNNTSLDVLAWSKYQPCFLNRQLVTLMSTLGIKDRVLERKQKEAINHLDETLTDPLKAKEGLELMSPSENTNILRAMLMCDYKPDVEPYLSMMLQTFRSLKLLEIRTKTRIFIPNGRCMMGCLDETGMLEYGQVFLQYSAPLHKRFFENSSAMISTSEPSPQVVEGKVVVAKNPCLHPGDMRVLSAVNVPALHHMVDCLVFPQKGNRPHPNECSGSDLDGDVYFVCWDPDLIPPRQFPPMDYTSDPSMVLDHEVTIEEVQEYFTNFVLNDSLGIICNAHAVLADKRPKKAMSDSCIYLSKLSSIAVDFPKTGVPAKVPSRLRVSEYPDFMEKHNKPTYESDRVIGKLYRAVKDLAPNTSPVLPFSKEMAWQVFDFDMNVEGFRNHIDDALYYKGEYDNRLKRLMRYYGVRTEAEMLSGWIMNMSKSFDKKKDIEHIVMAVRSLRNEARGWFFEKGSRSGSGHSDEYAKASAWYRVTYHPCYWGRGRDRHGKERGQEHLISFPWCVYDKLIEIKRDKVSRRMALDLPSLNRLFSRELVVE